MYTYYNVTITFVFCNNNFLMIILHRHMVPRNWYKQGKKFDEEVQREIFYTVRISDYLSVLYKSLMNS